MKGTSHSKSARSSALAALLSSSLLLASTAGLAAPVFSDDFNANSPALNVVPSGWTVSDGTVDIVGSGFFLNCPDGSAACIDLDGSTGDAGVLSHGFAAVAGLTYSLSYQLSGNLRGGSDVVSVALGAATQSHTLAAGDGLQTFTLSWLSDITGTSSISFSNAGGDNIGALLDNVALVDDTGGGDGSVPEPMSLALLGAGLAGLAASIRRRRAAR